MRVSPLPWGTRFRSRFIHLTTVVPREKGGNANRYSEYSQMGILEITADWCGAGEDASG